MPHMLTNLTIGGDEQQDQAYSLTKLEYFQAYDKSTLFFYKHTLVITVVHLHLLKRVLQVNPLMNTLTTDYLLMIH